MSGTLVELTPLPYLLLQLRGGVIFLRLRHVVLGHPALALSFRLWICRSEVSLLLFELLLDFDSISVRRAERGDVQELHLFLDVSV